MNIEELGNLFILYGLNILYALGLLVIGWWIASFVERIVLRALAATHRVDPTVAGFLGSIARYGVLVFVGVAVLQRFGIQTTSIIAVLGATSLAIGLALQGTLSNVAAGVMLLLFRPFKLGDQVEVGGQAGTVKGLTLFTTELASGDNIQVLMPNSKVWGAPIVNKSAYGARKFDFSLELKPDADIEGVMEEGLSFLRQDARVQQEPGPSAGISKMALDRVEIVFSGWASASEAGAVRGELIQKLRGKTRTGAPARKGADPQKRPAAGSAKPEPRESVPLSQP